VEKKRKGFKHRDTEAQRHREGFLTQRKAEAQRRGDGEKERKGCSISFSLLGARDSSRGTRIKTEEQRDREGFLTQRRRDTERDV